MKVALYFEKPDDLIQELRAVEEVSKRVGKFFIAFAAREECEFEMDGQKFFACAFDELSFDEFDYIIFPDDLSKINFPPEKILTPAQFTKKFLKDNPPPVAIFYLRERKVSCLRHAISSFCAYVEPRSCCRNYSFRLRIFYKTLHKYHSIL